MINPIRGTLYKCEKTGNNGINYINDACYALCAAFKGSSSAYDINDTCGLMCKDLVDSKRTSEHHPRLPVIWNQVPYYLPQLLIEGNNPDMALSKCYQLCQNDSDCILNCNASYVSLPVEHYSDDDSKKKKKSLIIFVAVTLLLLLLLVIIHYIYYTNTNITS